MPATTTPIAPGAPSVASALHRVRTIAKVQLIFQRFSLVLAFFMASALLLGAADYFLRFPDVVRLIIWMIGVPAVAVVLWRRLAPAARFSPSLTTIALRLEGTPEAREAGLRGVLAAGLDLAQTPPGDDLSRSLGELSTAEASRRYAAMGQRIGLLNPARLRRALAALCIAALPVGVLSVAAPDLLRIGGARVLTPWRGETWPKRTAIRADWTPRAHPIGAALPLRAVLERSPFRPGETDVAAMYRLVVDGKPQPERRALLTHQQRPSDDGATGEVYERLLDTTTLIPPEARAAGNIELEYVFRTFDDETAPWRVVLVEPPEVAGAALTVAPPAYASSVLASMPDIVTGEHDLGIGQDERASIGPILAGSTSRLVVTPSKTLPPPPEDAPAREAWIARTFRGLEGVNAGVVEGASGWMVEWTAQKPLRVSVVLADEFGITSTRDATFRFEVLEDRATQAAIIDPPHDEAVLPTALVGAVAEGRDDIAVSWVTLTSQTARPPADSQGAPPEPLGEPIEAARAAPADASRTALTQVRARTDLDLASIEAKVGDEIWLHAQAQDILGAATGRAPTTSARRRLRVISETEFVEQVRAELSGVRESARRLEADQARLLPRADRPADAGQSAAQKALADRIGPMSDVVERLARRVDRNRLDDGAFRDLLRNAGELLDAAGDHASDAAKRLDELASPDEPTREQAAAKAERAQQEAREDLEALASLMDTGNDTWAIRRALEKLLTQQQQVRSQTQAAGREMQGQSVESLTPAQRQDLERLAQRQAQAAAQSAAAMESLRQRAGQMEQADPAAAQAMKNAAERARLDQLRDKQEEAAEQIRQNQTGKADELQEQSERSIQRMLEALEQAEQARDERLRRVLAGVIESIEKLIASQSLEIRRLGDAVAGGTTGGLDAAMIVLHQNTLGVTGVVSNEVRGGDQVLAALRAASDAQSNAITGLRGADLPGADVAERTSLARLNDALAEANRLEEQAEERDAERKRAQLKEAYTQALEEQAAIAEQASPLVQKGDLDRRDRVAAQALGARQGVLRARLSDLVSDTQELEAAQVFRFAHQRLDEAMARSADVLGKGTAPPALARDQATSIRVLQQLVQAMAQAMKKNDFREDDSGGGEGDGGGNGQKPPLVPPIAELKLLRAMQDEAAAFTRRAAEAGELGADDLRDAAILQEEIATQAKQLLDKMKGPPAGAPIAPIPEEQP